MTLTFGSLFAGIGGFDLGFERAGMACRWQVEIDDYATKILEKHWPATPRFRDVRTVGVRDLGAVDVICGGFPCQDISTANTKGRLDLAGHKSGLWSEFRRIIGELRPTWVVIENVAHRWRNWLPVVRRELHGIGYAGLPLRVPAAYLGAHHERSRVFVVAHADGYGEPMRSLDAEVAKLSALAVADGNWGQPPPGVFRVADGVPNVMDRNRCVGGAVVPDIAEMIGRLIVAQNR